MILHESLQNRVRWWCWLLEPGRRSCYENAWRWPNATESSNSTKSWGLQCSMIPRWIRYTGYLNLDMMFEVRKHPWTSKFFLQSRYWSSWIERWGLQKVSQLFWTWTCYPEHIIDVSSAGSDIGARDANGPGADGPQYQLWSESAWPRWRRASLLFHLGASWRGHPVVDYQCKCWVFCL